MRIATDGTGLLLVALAIFAHAWIAKLTPQPFANAVGWVVAAVTLIVFGAHFVHCG